MLEVLASKASKMLSPGHLALYQLIFLELVLGRDFRGQLLVCRVLPYISEW